MFKPLPFFIGLRYTAAKRRNRFISFTSLISFLGLALGVWVLIVVLSVMNGFDRELKQRILGMVPHATITTAQGTIENWPELIKQVEESPEVIGAAPFISTQAMLTQSGHVKGAYIQGINPDYESKVSIIDEHLDAGKLTDLVPGKFGIILGDILSRQLGVNVGDKVTLVLPEASINPAGVFPRLKRFNVVGIFRVGAELDASLAYIHYKDAAKLMRINQGVLGIRLQLKDLFKSREVAWQVASNLPGRYYVRDWTRTHGSLFQAIQMEKTIVGLLLTLIIAVASFNIVATLVMVVNDKQSDIAILRTLGATTRTVMAIFMVQGAVIGVLGTLLGVIAGVVTALNLPAWIKAIEHLLNIQFLDSNVYFISYLPSQLQWQDVGLIAVATLLLSFLATVYPAFRAANTQPAEALRYE
ncbi:lipoprotein-releasing ABC transporter permease subunit [Endozoicomonas sp. SM1973]|uniref:Lipoprotein-releasing ABC transporter permease subunit n=1 Tax=Spartinivicinus marinus TaxID=2994442 RepID=A0A853HT85_9GAMM|nr:lipoprotein-releasing ABC transporter permease subunit [Spartinivicinus marinus]MCX4029416.1 lipoprotein-releasing ABC transporter permease subunit [Spartinivicinus marinus]NYZ64990.1 lipoprotein-releasing ABC transporter permease subunit [Spartinivicinus marinus]